MSTSATLVSPDCSVERRHASPPTAISQQHPIPTSSVRPMERIKGVELNASSPKASMVVSADSDTDSTAVVRPALDSRRKIA